MTQSELKELKAIGAELGAAKAENDRLRGLLERIATIAEEREHGYATRQHGGIVNGRCANKLVAMLPDIHATLSQQPEPTDTYTAVDMATAAAQGFRDGQAAVEQAPAQDEREAEAAVKALLFSGRLVDSFLIRDICKAVLATRPAQTEQQPVVVPEDFQPLETIRWWISAYTNPENGPSYQGHGMMVQMLCEYEALRIMLSSRAHQWPTAYPHEAMDKLAADRYRVSAAGAGPLSRYSVRAGDGEQELYRGSKSDCEHVARKLAGAFLDGGFAAFELYAAPIAQTAPQGKFRMGDLVKKSTGSEWVGRVVGWYSTEQTKEGYAVESSAHRNSVQIYPAKALEAVDD